MFEIQPLPYNHIWCDIYNVWVFRFGKDMFIFCMQNFEICINMLDSNSQFYNNLKGNIKKIKHLNFVASDTNPPAPPPPFVSDFAEKKIQ